MLKKSVLLWCVVGLTLVAVSSVLAQRGQKPQVCKILGISVEGNTLADPAAIIANSGLRVGDELVVGGDQTAQAIRKLWSLRIFDDIQIAIDRTLGDGIYLAIKVTELQRFDRMELHGNDEVSTSDIEKKINLVRGQIFPQNETTKIRKEILKMYEKEGYLLAKVKVKIGRAHV
jgi:outer membrane protein insertion porin family